MEGVAGPVLALGVKLNQLFGHLPGGLSPALGPGPVGAPQLGQLGLLPSAFSPPPMYLLTRVQLGGGDVQGVRPGVGRWM